MSNNPEERCSHLLRCESLKSRLSSWLVEQLSTSREGLCCMNFFDYVFARLEVLTSTLLKIQVFWNVTRRRLINNYHLACACLPAKGFNITEGFNLHFVFFPRYLNIGSTPRHWEIIPKYELLGFGAHCDGGIATAFSAPGGAQS